MPKVRHNCPFEGCPKTFSRKPDVIRHLDTHDPETKYRFKCTYEGCTKTDRQKANVTSHMWRVHGVDASSEVSDEPRKPKSEKERVHSKPARSRSFDQFEGVEEMKGEFDWFPMQSTGPSEQYSAQPWVKAEEEPNWSLYLVDDLSTPTSSTSYVPKLSPSGSSYTSTPTPSTPTHAVPYPTTAYPTTAYPATTIEPTQTPAQSFEFNDDFQYPQHPQFISTPVYNYYIGYCTEQLRAASAQQDMAAVQYWYACLGAVIDAYGVPEPVPTPEQAPEDMYYNVPGWGQPEPEPEPERVLESPAVDPEAFDFSAFDFSGAFNYFDVSWSAPVPMNNFETLYGLNF